MPAARSPAWGRCPSPGVLAGGPGRLAGGLPPASCRTPVMAAASAAPRVNRRIPSRSGFGGVTAVTVPSAATWQVTPAGQAPSRTAAMPVRRPASRIPASRRAGPCPVAAISVTPGPACAGRRAGVRQVVVREVRAAEACQGELEAFQFAEGGIERAGDGQAGDRGGLGAGQQPGGVGGGDDRGGQPGLAGRGLGEQGGEDRAGGRLGAGAGQAEAAEGRDVDGGLGAVAADAERDRAGRQLAPGGVLRPRLRHAARVLAGRGGAVAVRVRPGAGLVQVEVRVGGVRVPGLRPGGWRGRPGGAAQGADDLGQRRRVRLEGAGRAGAGAVAAAPLDGGQGERGGDHDRDGDPDQGAGRQPYRDPGRVRGAGRRCCRQPTVPGSGPSGMAVRSARLTGRAGGTAPAVRAGRRAPWSRGGPAAGCPGAGRGRARWRAGGSAAPSRG